MSGIANPFTDSKTLRDALRLDLQQLSQQCGLPIDELQKIEAGEDVPLSALRDVAFCLGTGVTGVLGDGYFQTSVSRMDYFVKNDSTTINFPGGFWGYWGILVQGQPKYQWFPITAYTRQLIYKSSTEKYMAVPCMDNSLLLINCEKVEELVLLDEACDSPTDMDWDCTLSEGEIPAVVYEAFNDYMAYKDSKGSPSDYDLSQSLVDAIDHIIDTCKIDPDSFLSKLNTATIMFSSGRVQQLTLSYDGSDSLATAVQQINETGSLFNNNIVMIEGYDEVEALVNFKNISMIQLLLVKTESAIKEALSEVKD